MGSDILEECNYKRAAELWWKLLQYGIKEEFIQNTDEVPSIPEIMIQAKSVSGEIHTHLLRLNKKEFFLDPLNYMMTSLGWSAYAGMGSTYHWHLNREELKAKGIYETLTAERGLDCMDEYVTDIIGKIGRAHV